MFSLPLFPFVVTLGLLFAGAFLAVLVLVPPDEPGGFLGVIVDIVANYQSCEPKTFALVIIRRDIAYCRSRVLFVFTACAIVDKVLRSKNTRGVGEVSDCARERQGFVGWRQ
jgi:hypothetical protein